MEINGLYAKISKMLDDYEPINAFSCKEDLLFWYNRLRTNILNLDCASRPIDEKGLTEIKKIIGG